MRVCEAMAAMSACVLSCFSLQPSPTHCSGVCGKVCGTSEQCRSGVCAENSVACNQGDVNFSGGQGVRSYSVQIGTGGSQFRFYWDAKDIPDRYTIYTSNGTQLYQVTGGQNRACSCRGCRNWNAVGNNYNRGVSITRPSGVSTIRITVEGPCSRTQWRFKVDCSA